MVVVWLFVNVSWATQAPGTTAEKDLSVTGDRKGAPVRLSFAREFSSARDVRRAHPVLDRSLDIIAGPKTGEASTDILQAPYAVTTDSEHRVFVTDISARKVHIFDFGHSRYSFLQDKGDRLRQPVGVAADREGNVYVSDIGSGAILVFDARGKFRRYLRESKGTESYFQGPMGIAVDTATEHLYVCDSPRHMVIVLDKKGHVLDRFGRRGGGTQPGEFRYPTQLVATGGEIVVLDSGNRRVQILDVRGRFRREIRISDVDNRSGLAVDGEQNVYLSDAVVNQVQVFNREGRLLYVFGQMGAKAGEFDGASGLWVDSGRCLYVVDKGNKRVQAFQIHGQNTKGCQ